MNYEAELLLALAEDRRRRLLAEAERERLAARRQPVNGGGGAGKAVAGWLRTAADHLDQPRTQHA
jgi:hypothetical protein